MATSHRGSTAQSSHALQIPAVAKAAAKMLEKVADRAVVSKLGNNRTTADGVAKAERAASVAEERARVALQEASRLSTSLQRAAASSEEAQCQKSARFSLKISQAT